MHCNDLRGNVSTASVNFFQIVIMTNMNSYSQLAMEYFNIRNGKSKDTSC